MGTHHVGLGSATFAIVLLAALYPTISAISASDKGFASLCEAFNAQSTCTGSSCSHTFTFDTIANATCLYQRATVCFRVGQKWIFKGARLVRPPSNYTSTNCTERNMFVSGDDIFLLDSLAPDCFATEILGGSCPCGALRMQGLVLGPVDWTRPDGLVNTSRVACDATLTYLYAKIEGCTIQVGRPLQVVVEWQLEDNHDSFCRSKIAARLQAIIFTVYSLFLLAFFCMIVAFTVAWLKTLMNHNLGVFSFLFDRNHGMFSVSRSEGRMRWLTIWVVMAVGLNITMITYPPSLRPATAYDGNRAKLVSFDLQKLLPGQTESWGVLLRFAMQPITILAISASWGLLVFCTLIVNYSDPPDPQKHSYSAEKVQAYRGKAIVSSIGLLMYDFCCIVFLLVTFVDAARWTQPAAYYIMVLASAVAVVLANAWFVALLLRGHPTKACLYNPDATASVHGAVTKPPPVPPPPPTSNIMKPSHRGWRLRRPSVALSSSSIHSATSGQTRWWQPSGFIFKARPRHQRNSSVQSTIIPFMYPEAGSQHGQGQPPIFTLVSSRPKPPPPPPPPPPPAPPPPPPSPPRTFNYAFHLTHTSSPEQPPASSAGNTTEGYRQSFPFHATNSFSSVNGQLSSAQQHHTRSSPLLSSHHTSPKAESLFQAVRQQLNMQQSASQSPMQSSMHQYHTGTTTGSQRYTGSTGTSTNSYGTGVSTFPTSSNTHLSPGVFASSNTPGSIASSVFVPLHPPMSQPAAVATISTMTNPSTKPAPGVPVGITPSMNDHSRVTPLSAAEAYVPALQPNPLSSLSSGHAESAAFLRKASSRDLPVKKLSWKNKDEVIPPQEQRLEHLQSSASWSSADIGTQRAALTRYNKRQGKIVVTGFRNAGRTRLAAMNKTSTRKTGGQPQHLKDDRHIKDQNQDDYPYLLPPALPESSSCSWWLPARSREPRLLRSASSVSSLSNVSRAVLNLFPDASAMRADVKQFLSEWKRTRAHFKFSAWFLAAVYISAVLVLFFFTKQLYLVTDLAECLDPSTSRCSFLGPNSRKWVATLVTVADTALGGKDTSGVDVTMQLLNLQTSGKIASWLAVQRPKLVNSSNVQDLRRAIRACDRYAAEIAVQDLSLSLLNEGSLYLLETLKIDTTLTDMQQLLNRLLLQQVDPALTECRSNTTSHYTLQEGVGDSPLVKELKTRARKALANQSHFFKQLHRSFRLASLLGCCLGALVALLSLLVILMVYRNAIAQVRKELVITALVNNLDNSVTTDVFMEKATMAREIKNHHLTPSVYFYGVVFSTCLIQLFITSSFFAAIFTLLFHPGFWVYVFPYVAAVLMSLVSAVLLIRYLITNGVAKKVVKDEHIYNRSAWLCYFIVFSFAYIVMGWLVAAIRIVLVMISTLVFLCRIDKCVNVMGKSLDPAYTSFLSMMKMHVELRGMRDLHHSDSESDDEFDLVDVSQLKGWALLRHAVKTGSYKEIKEFRDRLPFAQQIALAQRQRMKSMPRIASSLQAADA